MKLLLRLAICLVVLQQAAAFAQTTSPIAVLPGGSSLQYNGPVSQVAGPARLRTKIGTIQAAIKLSDPPLVVAVGANAKQNVATMKANGFDHGECGAISCGQHAAEYGRFLNARAYEET